MDYDSMSIEELENEVNRIESEVAKLRGTQRLVHDAMEKQIKLIKIVPTSKDQKLLQ